MSEQVLRTYRLPTVTSLDTIEFEQESIVPWVPIIGALLGYAAARAVTNAVAVGSFRRVRHLNKIGNAKEGQ